MSLLQCSMVLFTKSSELEELSSKILHQLEQASTDQKAYYGKLNTVSGEIAAVPDADSLANMIKTVLAETKKIVGKSQQLKESLDESSVEVTALKRDLEDAREDAWKETVPQAASRQEALARPSSPGLSG